MTGIIVLNYNKWDDTYACINSIIENFESNTYRIYLIDNNSPIKMSIDYMNFFEVNNVSVFINNMNAGYSHGNRDNCDDILICNNDIIFIENTLKKMREFIVNSNTDVVGPKIILPNNKMQEVNLVERLTFKTKIKHMFRMNSDVRKKINYGMMNVLDFHSQVYFVSGCCFLVNQSALDIIFPMDEDFFMYEEEAVMGHKLSSGGKVAEVFNSSVVLHNHDFSKGISARSYTTFVKSELIYLKKYQKSKNIHLFLIFLFRFFRYFVASLYKKDYFYGYRDFFSEVHKSCKRYGKN